VNEVESLQWQRPVPGAAIFLWRDFLRPSTADDLLKYLLEQVPWRQDTVRVFGKRHPLPRLQQWYGDPKTTYRWSGLAMRPLAWTLELNTAREAVQTATQHAFNSVLLNYYRTGNDTVSWHADDEPELGTAPVIASVSLGATRDFSVRRKSDPKTKHTFALPHGSLLVMSGETQSLWEHSLPRRKRINQPRVNMTFRLVRSRTPHS